MVQDEEEKSEGDKTTVKEGVINIISMKCTLSQSLFIYYNYNHTKVRLLESVPKLFLSPILSTFVLFSYVRYTQVTGELPNNLLSGFIYLIKIIALYLILYIVLLYFVISINNIEKPPITGLIKKVRKWKY
ncbi:hypothetical protein KO317_03170 [Candidatus Micrarchaeota archaeon]|jgi:hypothetical protein|nr:hypothetical protein [Candidatus Micrarchaeota archaeon]